MPLNGCLATFLDMPACPDIAERAGIFHFWRAAAVLPHVNSGAELGTH